MANYFGLPDAGSDEFDVNDWHTKLREWKDANPGRIPLGQEFGLTESSNIGNWNYYGSDVSDLSSFLNKYQGPGTRGTDASTGINYYAPTSGKVNPFPEWNKYDFMDDTFGLLAVGGIAGAGLAGLGAGAAGTGYGVGGEALSALQGVGAGSGFSAGSSLGGSLAAGGIGTTTAAGGAGMWDWLDDFVELVGDSSADVSGWGGDISGWSTNPSLTDLGGNGFDFGNLTNSGGLDGPMGDSLRNYFSEMGPNNPFSPGNAGNSAWSSFTDFLKNPLIEGTNATGGNVLSSLANYLIRNQQSGRLNDAANRSAQLNDPMQQPQRAPFQQAFTNLMTNPNSYQQTPYAQGMTNQANQAFQANVSKYGPGGTQFSDYLKNYQNILSSDFFNLANTLSTAGGFNQGTGGAGSAFGQLAGAGANAGMGAWEGFGSLFGSPRPQSIFGAGNATTFGSGQNSPFQITYNPAGNVNLGAMG